jgi:predicted acetyltransferase
MRRTPFMTQWEQEEVLELRVLTADLGPEYLAMVDEAIESGEGYPYNNIELAREEFAAFVRELDEEAQGIGLPRGIDPQQTYVLVKDGTTVVGEIRFRPTLTPPYEDQHGHIGYNIRPSQRGKGYATAQLALVLAEARRLTLSGVMLTIEGHNPAPVRVIEKNGGRLLRQITDPDLAQITSCYWIDLAEGTSTEP